MTSDLFLGLDVGTGATKAVLADSDGTVLASAHVSYSYEIPRRGWAEQDPETWWQAVCQATRAVLNEQPGAARCVRAVAVSGQGVAAVLLDAKGRLLRKAILWPDRRCTAEAQQMNELQGDAIQRISGKRPAAYNVEPKLLWLRKHEPETWRRTALCLTTTAYVTYQLCGAPVMNHSDAGILLSYDLHAGGWSAVVLDALGLPRSIFPALADSSEPVGVLLPVAAAAMGLRPRIPVVAGGEDTSAAGLAIGALLPERGQLSLGTANTVNVSVDGVATHPRLLAFPHVIPGMTLLGGSMSSGGLSMRWISDVLGCERVETLLDEAVTAEPGARGVLFLPYLAGELQPVNDGAARGAFTGLTAETTRGDMMRAVLEGNAFAIHHNLQCVREAGPAPRLLLAVGGPTRSPLLCQTIADVTGMEVRVMSESRGAALGSAMLAAAGVLPSFDLRAMAVRQHRATHAYTPSPAHHERYCEAFEDYLELYPQLRYLNRNYTSMSEYVHI